MEEKLLKLQDVAERLSASRTTIYRLIGTGELKPIKMGRVLRFPASDVDKLIENMKEKSDAKAA